MRTMTINETREVCGAASKYVTCPICGYRKKTNWLERLIFPNFSIRTSLSEAHRGKRNANVH